MKNASKQTTFSIDINCDLGEGSSLNDCEKDALLMPFISSCNIACGGHAGNEVVIRESLLNAKKHQLKIGAHPGYADQHNFGRVSLGLPQSVLIDDIKRQLMLFEQIADSLGIEIHHIKFHGALYNDLEQSYELRKVVVGLLKKNYAHLKVIALAGGEFLRACHDSGLTYIAEAFMDRRYLTNGQLMPRTEQSAVIGSIEHCLLQAENIVKKGQVLAQDNRWIKLQAETLCLHGDNDHAYDVAKRLHQQFKQSGILIQ